MKTNKPAKLLILLVVFVLMSSIVLADSTPISTGQTIVKGDTFQGVSTDVLNGKTVAGINGQLLYTTDGNAYAVRTKDGKKGLYNANGDRISGDGPKVDGLNIPPLQTPGSPPLQGATAPSPGTTQEPDVREYSYFDSNGNQHDYTVTNDGNTYTVVYKTNTINYQRGSVLDGVDWTKITQEDISNNGKTIQTEQGTITIDDTDRSIGNKDTSYTFERPDGTVAKFEYGSGGSRTLVSDQQKITVDGNSYTIDKNYQENTVTVPAGLVGSSQVTFDTTVWETSSTPDWKITQEQSKDGEKPTIYFSDTHRIIKDGDTYIEQTKGGNNPFVNTRTIKVEDINNGKKRTITDHGSDGKTTSTTIQRNYNNGEIIITKKKDKDSKTTSLTIQRQGKDDVILGSEAENYIQNRELTPKTADEIAFAHEHLGSSGTYANGKYTSDKQGEVEVKSALMVYTSADGKQGETLVTLEIESLRVGKDGQKVPVDKGDRYSYNEQGGTLADKDGHYKHIYDSKSGLHTSISGSDNNRQYVTTASTGIKYTYQQNTNRYTTDRVVGDAQLSTFDSDGHGYVYVDGNELRASELYDSEGNLKAAYKNKAITNKKNGGSDITKKITQDNIQTSEKEAQKTIETTEKTRETDQANEEEIKEKERARRAGEVYLSKGWRTVISWYQAYTPLHELSNLLLTSTGNEDWLHDVDNFFATNYLGVEYWASDICRQSYDFTEDFSNAVIETPEGLVQFIGHVEGERSEPVPIVCTANQECVNFTKNHQSKCQDKVCKVNNQDILNHFYKITYTVTAPTDEKLTPHKDEKGAISFNIILKGSGTVTPLYTGYFELNNGQSKKDFYVQYSPRVYDQVCIWFGKKPKSVRPGSGEKMTEEICNTIAGSQRSFINFQSAPISNSPAPTGINYNQI